MGARVLRGQGHLALECFGHGREGRARPSLCPKRDFFLTPHVDGEEKEERLQKAGVWERWSRTQIDDFGAYNQHRMMPYDHPRCDAPDDPALTYAATYIEAAFRDPKYFAQMEKPSSKPLQELCAVEIDAFKESRSRMIFGMCNLPHPEH